MCAQDFLCRSRCCDASDKQKRIAREEEPDQEPRLREDDQEQHRVGPRAVAGDDLGQMAVDVQDEIDDPFERIHRKEGGAKKGRQ